MKKNSISAALMAALGIKPGLDAEADKGDGPVAPAATVTEPEPVPSTSTETVIVPPADESPAKLQADLQAALTENAALQAKIDEASASLAALSEAGKALEEEGKRLKAEGEALAASLEAHKKETEEQLKELSDCNTELTEIVQEFCSNMAIGMGSRLADVNGLAGSKLVETFKSLKTDFEARFKTSRVSRSDASVLEPETEVVVSSRRQRGVKATSLKQR